MLDSLYIRVYALYLTYFCLLCLGLCKNKKKNRKQQKMSKKQPNITKKRISLESFASDTKGCLTNRIFVNSQAVL